MKPDEVTKLRELTAHVAALAQQHGVTPVKSGDDALADVITRLAGDEVVTDATEDLIVALKRANVIDGQTMVDLLGQYLVMKSHVESMTDFGQAEKRADA